MNRVIAAAALMAAIVLTVATAAVGVAVGASRATSPTLSATKHVAGLPAVAYGTSIKLYGHESQGVPRSFVLQAQTFPFARPFATIARGNTVGSYLIAVEPTHATRYRVRVGTATSRVLTVYVLGRRLTSSCNLCRHSTPGTHTLIVDGSVLQPPGSTALRGPGYFYYGQANGSSVPPSSLHLVKTAPFEIRAQVLSFTVSYPVHFPSGEPFRFNFVYCVRDAESKDGINLPGHR